MRTPYPSSKLRFIDILVLVIFIFTAFTGLYLFRRDLMRTFELRDSEPAGIIIVRNNIIQRRHDNTVLWDRIFVSSFVYPGDLIRASDFSFATIDIASNEISLNENTLIRIQPSAEGMGNLQIELREGNINVTSNEDSSGIFLNLMGKIVQTMSGTALSASVSEEGVAIEVNEGSAEIKSEGQTRTLTGGSIAAFDAAGTEKAMPSASVRRPSYNARFLNSSGGRYAIDFSWRKINLAADDLLRLEIARDNNFSAGYQVINNLDESVRLSFENGIWYWRLSFEDTILRNGWFTIFDASGPALVSPVMNSTVFYNDSGVSPPIRFQWKEKNGASSYIAEISGTPDFSDIHITRKPSASFMVLSGLDFGTWYWRVKPVFISNAEGEASFSGIGSFTIERAAGQTEDSFVAAAAVVIPQTSIEQARERAGEERAGRLSEPSAAIEETRPITARESNTTRDMTVQQFAEARNTRSEPLAATRPEQQAVIRSEQPAVTRTEPVTRPELVTRPEPVIRPEPLRARSRETYTVRAGDTLGRIANRYYNDPMQWERIAEANNIRNPDLIYPGQVFIIP